MTMRRMILVWVMILCIGLICSTALAVDWEQYAVPSDLDVSLLLLENGNEVSWWREDKSLRWFRDGEEVARLTENDCPLNGSLTTRVALRSDGNLALLLKRAPHGPYDKGVIDPVFASYGIWTPDGFTMVQQWTADGEAYSVMDDHGFLLAEASGQTWLYDFDCQQIWSGILGTGTLSRPYSLHITSQDDWTVAVTDWNRGGSFACCRYLNGQMAWSRETMRYPRFLPLDSGWTVIAEHRADGKNGRTYLSLIDPEGNLTVSRYMSGDRLSVTCTSPMKAENGTIVIYGHATGNRRGVYQCWKACFDEQLNLLALDVRNCHYHNDYSASIWVNRSGSAQIRLEDRDRDSDKASAVFVPFEAFPVVTDHSLQYGWGRPENDDSNGWEEK